MSRDMDERGRGCLCQGGAVEVFPPEKKFESYFPVHSYSPASKAIIFASLRARNSSTTAPSLWKMVTAFAAAIVADHRPFQTRRFRDAAERQAIGCVTKLDPSIDGHADVEVVHGIFEQGIGQEANANSFFRDERLVAAEFVSDRPRRCRSQGSSSRKASSTWTGRRRRRASAAVSRARPRTRCIAVIRLQQDAMTSLVRRRPRCAAAAGRREEWPAGAGIRPSPRIASPRRRRRLDDDPQAAVVPAVESTGF